MSHTPMTVNHGPIVQPIGSTQLGRPAVPIVIADKVRNTGSLIHTTRTIYIKDQRGDIHLFFFPCVAQPRGQTPVLTNVIIHRAKNTQRLHLVVTTAVLLKSTTKQKTAFVQHDVVLKVEQPGG